MGGDARGRVDAYRVWRGGETGSPGGTALVGGLGGLLGAVKVLCWAGARSLATYSGAIRWNDAQADGWLLVPDAEAGRQAYLLRRF